jgi:NADH-ubiquinone oxidoreductase chain 5
MYLSIITLPLIGCIFSGLLGRVLSPKGSSFISIVCVFFSLLLSFLSIFEVGFSHCPTFIKFQSWFDSELFDPSWGFCFDSLTVSMCVTVTFISILVHIYSTSYMSHDPHQSRFMCYLSLFTFSMLMLITADNFLQLFFGWESVGLCSYLLINFWFTRLSANKAAIKAMIINRIGDFGLALGIFFIFATFKSVDYAILFSLVPYYTTKTIYFLQFELDLITIICILLFIGSMGKSAQLGLHTWLPDAMEGPTPVSALIHAATMVTAGVFLIIRCSFLYEHSYLALLILTLVGSMTAFFSGIIGILQNDLKKVIAYSTCSQLGYMIFACGLSNYSVSMFHLINHAYFKALLFLSAGSIIHALSDEQDIRKMGGLAQILPFSYTMILVGSLALMGFPFLTGFYSKDVILEVAYANYSFSGIISFFLGLISASFTSFYSFRLVYLTFLGNPNGFKQSMQNANDAPFALGFTILILGFLSVISGFLSKDLFIGLGTPYWNNSIYILPEHIVMVDTEFLLFKIKWLPFFITFFFATFSFLIYSYGLFLFIKIYKTSFGHKFFIFINRKWLFDKLQNEIISIRFLYLGYTITYKTIDKGLIELFGPTGFSKLILHTSKITMGIQSGLLNHYTFVMFLGLIIFISFLIFFSIYSIYIEIHIFFLLILAYLFINL